MYSVPHYLGDNISRLMVVGIREDSTPIDISPDDLAIDYWHYQVLARAIQRKDAPLIRDLLLRYEARRNVTLTAVRLEDRPIRWTPTIAKPAPVQVMAEYTLR